jgi:GT2 family glycosyltransferase
LPPLAGQSLAEAFQFLINGGHDWILPIFAGDHVSEELDAVLGKARAAKPSIIYWDEDRLIGGNRADPWIKPDWDELIFLARDCLSGSAIYKADLALAACSGFESTAVDPASLHRLALSAVRLASCPPLHVPLILTHRTASNSTQSQHQWCHEVSHGWPVPIDCCVNDEADEFLKVSPRPPAEWPKVSILIPTKDRGALLQACADSLGLLQYKGEVELIVIDNGTTEPQACAILDRLAASTGARILKAPGPFNFSALNNLAASQASGELLCLLNNDVEAIEGDWLEAMVRHATTDGVGAIGAQLLYPDCSIQHAGVVIGLGEAAGHVEKGRSSKERGFFGWHGVTREVSAVTAACLLVRRDLYLSVGGLDERRFPVAFNDVDFCLRLKALGYRNLVVAEAQLIHHESVSRGNDWAPANLPRFQMELSNLQERWGTKSHQDPHFSTLFAKTSEQCVLAV